MRSVSLTAELELIDLALFLPQQRALAIADIHLGIEDALNDEGVLVPRSNRVRVQHRLERIFQELHVAPSRPLHRVILNGDLRHRFGPLSRVEHKESQEFLSWLTQWTEQIVLIEGNHDSSLQQFVSERIMVTKSFREGDCWFVHGDESETDWGGAEESWLVIGHEHPAVSLRDPVTGRVEVYKCFLVGKFRGRNLLVLPSFNQLVRGSDLLKEQPLSPFVNQGDLGDFSVYLVSDDGGIYEFGPLCQLLV